MDERERKGTNVLCVDMSVFCKDCILKLISDPPIGVLPVKQADAVYKLIQNMDEFNSDLTSKNMLQMDGGSDI